MYCQKCGSQIEEGNSYCPKCGIPISQQISTVSDNSIRYQEPGRGTLILILGIFSIILLGPFVGIPAWVMGNKDLKKIKSGIIALSEKTTTQVGMILGIIGTFISSVTIIIIGIAIVVGINLSSNAAEELAKDTLVSEGVNIAALAQQYYKKTIEMGGGDGAFTNFVIPEKLQSTMSADWEADVEAQQVTLTGTPKDETYAWTVVVTITPNTISTEVQDNE